MLITLVALWLLQAPATHGLGAPVCPHEMIPRYWLQPIYPKDAVKKKLGGKVRLEALVAGDGRVKKVVTLAGDGDLADAADDALKQWKFQPCVVAGATREATATVEFDFQPATWQVMYSAKLPPYPKNPNHPEQTLQRVRVNPGVIAANLRYGPKPKYPLKADLLRVQGEVLLHVVIGRDGAVEILGVDSGPEELRPETMNTVRQWRYKPFLLKDEPVEVETGITIRFRIND